LEASTIPAIAEVIHRIDRDWIIQAQDTMASRIESSEAAYLHRMVAWVAVWFSLLALLLGTVGLYGVISYSVGQRTREIGVRMALGAQRSGVYRLIVLECCRLTAVGAGSGMLCSFLLAGLLRKLLFGVGRWDITVTMTVLLVLAVASVLASFFPARQAASVDPKEALRAE
jgi:macrolide transport system ATP-binding/permease protein